MIIWLLFLATIPVSNFMIGNIGTSCIADGPCMLPVGFGYTAPSGVFMIGIALVLRDLIQERYGKWSAFLAVLVGSAISYILADPYIAAASVTAYLLAEISDLIVYTKLRKKSLSAAVLASGLVGSIIDSAVFLFIAFGSLQFIEGQIIGKLWMSIFAIAVLRFIKSRASAPCKTDQHIKM